MKKNSRKIKVSPLDAALLKALHASVPCSRTLHLPVIDHSALIE